MTNLHPPTREIYVRTTGVDGNTYVSSHFVWSAERFVQAQQEQARAANDKQKPGEPRHAKAEQITHEQFVKAKTQ